MDKGAQKREVIADTKGSWICALQLDPEDEHYRSKLSLGSHGYPLIRGTSELLHRRLADVPRGKVVDHKNGDQLDCRKENLRCVTQQENIVNAPKRKDNTSGFKGVYYHKQINRWVAAFGKQHIGSFTTPDKANCARLKYEQEHFGISPRRLVDFQAVGL